MDAGEIRRLAGKSPLLSGAFRGVYPKGTFPDMHPAWGGFLMNTRKSLPGEHWIAVYVSPEADSDVALFFDSHGKSPRHWGMDFAGRLMLYNDFTVQPKDSVLCGLYSLLFVYLKATGCSMGDVVDLFLHAPDNLQANEEIVLDFADKLNAEQLK